MNLDIPFSTEYSAMIKRFIRTKADEAGVNGIVVGVSGGLDSAVVLKLAVGVFDQDNVQGVFLPETTTPKQDAADAHLIARECAVDLIELPINDILASYLELETISDPDALSLGNLKARIRMNILYLVANMENHLVLGTSNKTELLLGYFTKFGDGGSDIAPLGDLYKTQVRQLAAHLGVPKNIVTKAPTAGLLENQTDEQDIGMDYETVDKILYGLERNLSNEKIAHELAIGVDQVSGIKERMEQNRHKRKFSKIPKIGIKTVGLDLYE